MARVVTLSLIIVVVVALIAGCGGGESQQDIASEVAMTWVDESIEDVSDAVVQLMLGDIPGLSQIAGDALTEQIHENVEWSYSTGKSLGENKFQLSATGSVTVKVEIPLLGTKAYVVSVPFVLDVDTNSRTVDRWSPDLSSASVQEQDQ